MQAKTNPACPKCGSLYKRFPPGRQGQYHVFCEECSHDFGRLDALQAEYKHVLDELESQLKALHPDEAESKPKGE